MGSSETGGGVVDCSVGSIVWVRRRNGSWWPGKVLGPDELSSSHITSPRSGTPVKLLGREDASVDWYNLEKSKRVKSFRCGEFDDCIERAEAAQGMPPKKREKYARREDAILHALELERQLLEKKYGKLGYSFNGRSKRSPDAVTSSEYLENNGGNQTDPRSNQVSEGLGSSPADKNAADNLNGETLREGNQLSETLREGNQLSGDDDSAGVLPRMRGLQDFGLRTAPPLREELSGVAFRAKRSRYAYLTNDSGNYLTDSQIQSSQMEIPVSIFEESDCLYPADLGEEHISGSTEDTETDCSETDSLESDSDDEMTALSDGSASLELRPKYTMRIETRGEHGSISSDDFDDLTLADDSTHPFPNDLVSTSMGVSKWQLKGKRNNRSLGKRSLDRTDAEASRGYVNGRNSNWSSGGCKADLIKRSSRSHFSRYGSTERHGSHHNIYDLPGLTWNNPSAMRGYWDDSQEYIDPIFVDTHYFGGRIILVDVDLKVQASNYRRDVPMISLMSKLNGHAIVGHPIQTEALESGSSENLIAGTNYFFAESLESPVIPRVWKTGRRTTNSRIPRPHLSLTLDSDSKQQYAQSGDQDRKLPFGTDQESFTQKANMTRKSYFPYPMDRRSSRNSPKKISPSSNQKIRTLSSIASEQKHHDGPRSGGSNYQVDGLLKTEGVPTTVACIPVNLVFSRLHEELVDRHQ